MLTNRELQNKLDKNGYILLDLLNIEQIQSLLKLYKKEKPLFHRHHTYCNIFNAGYKKNVRIENKIKEIILPVLDTAMSNVKVIGGCFLVKKNYGDNEVGLHQDWRITDEDQHQSYNIWIPLVDVDESNGTMAVLQKSHIYFNNAIRSYNIPSEYIALNDRVGKAAMTIKLKAGQALVYSSALFHGSFPNQSKSDRPVIILSCCDKAAELCYFYYNENEDKTYKLKRPNDFHLKYSKSIATTVFNYNLQVLSVLDGKPHNFSYEEISQKYMVD